jgi:hypothetical protein
MAKRAKIRGIPRAFCGALMLLNAFACILCALGAVLGTQSMARAQDIQKAGRPDQSKQIEEIYIARSVRESRVAPSKFCARAKTGFDSAFEDLYTFRSTAIRTSDGRMVDTNVKTIGSGHACFGQTSDPAILHFDLELLLGQTALKGIGDCRLTKSDFPERGLTPNHCFS